MTKEELMELKEKILKLKDFADAPKLLPKQTAYSFVYENNKNRLDQIAINYLGRKYTYGELFNKIDLCAKAYKEMGVKKGDMVSVSMLMTPETIISFYALNKIGAVAHMVNITHNVEETENALRNTNSKLFVTHDIFYTQKIRKAVENAGVENVIVSSLDESLFKGFYGDRFKIKLINLLKKVGNEVSKDNKCIRWKNFEKLGENSNIVVKDEYIPNLPTSIAYTSGSTGMPKAVLATNEAFNSLPVQLGMTDQMFIPGDSIFTTLPSWIYYSLVNNMHNPLCLGVSLDIDPLFNPSNIHKRLKQYRFNHWNTIPAYVDGMVHNKKVNGIDLSFLKSITTGGDYLTTKLKSEGEELLKNNNSNIYIGQGYGASELLGSFGYTYEKNMSPNTIGKPLVGNKFKVLDLTTGEELGPNCSGELYLYSPSLMMEYYGNPEATNKSIITDENGVRWYKTEDVAHYNEKGELFIDGRLRRIELSKDEQGNPAKVFPDRIKQVVLKHPSVEKCEVIMVPDDERILRPAAYIVLKHGVELSNELVNEIKKVCTSEKLEVYSMPIKYTELSEIPLTPALKPDFKKLEEMYIEEKEKEKPKSKKILFKA